jgi:ATP-dependent helicase/nuclease subunit A
MVQGVIDVVLEDANGNLILCDYKTDYLSPDELSDENLAIKKLTERHAEQLKYYATAVKQLFGRDPDRICIYSLPLGKAVDINI